MGFIVVCGIILIVEFSFLAFCGAAWLYTTWSGDRLLKKVERETARLKEN